LGPDEIVDGFQVIVFKGLLAGGSLCGDFLGN
jgi:hypothetical protein